MLLFTRIVGLGFLFNFCLEGFWAWVALIVMSLFFASCTGYSCYLTIMLRSLHQNSLQLFQHLAYAEDYGRSGIILISLLLTLDYGMRPYTYFLLFRRLAQTAVCKHFSASRDVQSDVDIDDNKWFSFAENYAPLLAFAITLPFCINVKITHVKVYARLLFYTITCVFLVSLVAGFFRDSADSR